MKKRICLGLLALAFGCSCMAQRGPILNFTAGLKESNKVVWLQWDADSAAEGDFFIVERSQDETHFETIGALRSTGVRGHYELTDQAPPNGTDFYRIKYTRQSKPVAGKPIGDGANASVSTAKPTVDDSTASASTTNDPAGNAPANNDSAVYSKTLQLSLSSDVDFKFYPNPVDKVFIVRTEHSLDLQILDPSGNTRLSKRLQPGIQVVNVASLESGVYILRVTDKESNRAVSQRMVKN